MAQELDGGLLAGLVCSGTCGTSGANGVVPLAPSVGSRFGWLGPRFQSSLENPLNIRETTNGSRPLSSALTTIAGQSLGRFLDPLVGHPPPRRARRRLGRPCRVSGCRSSRRASRAPPGTTPVTLGNPARLARGGPAFVGLGEDSGNCYGPRFGYTGPR